MGFDIIAYPSKSDLYPEVASFRTYMGTFEMLKDEGYDWFRALDAEECYGGVSGTNRGKHISIDTLTYATLVLKDFEPLPHSEGLRMKPILLDFMKLCINWCKENNKNDVYILFA
jgi:hypothetical protein